MFVINLLRKLGKDNEGATAVEYGLILAMVFLAMITALQGVGNENTNVWGEIQSASEEAMGS